MLLGRLFMTMKNQQKCPVDDPAAFDKDEQDGYIKIAKPDYIDENDLHRLTVEVGEREDRVDITNKI